MSYMSLLLNQNLLSVLTLTSKHAFRVVIESDTMEFIKDSIPRFYASVGADLGRSVEWEHCSAVWSLLLHRSVELLSLPMSSGIVALAISVLSPQILVEHEMVSNLSLPSVPSSSQSALLHGWQADSRPLPPIASRRSIPLELVHSDLHGPLPPTANGFKYWISFTDDASRFRRCWLLHKKSEAFEAFQALQGLG
jgi:hypothetical protein